MATTNKPIILDETGKLIAGNISSQTEALQEILERYYSPFIGATDSANGESGLVPAPAAGTERFLRSDGAWTALPPMSEFATVLSNDAIEYPLLAHVNPDAAEDTATASAALFNTGVTMTPSTKSINVTGGVYATRISSGSATLDSITTREITLNGDLNQHGSTNIYGSLYVQDELSLDGDLSCNTLTSHGKINAGSIECLGEVIGKQHLRLQSSDGTHDLIIRDDGADAWFLFSDYHGGAWNSLRPLKINVATGNLVAGGTFKATKVYGAVWNDYAEFFPRGEETEVGDFVALSLDSEEEVYVKASLNTSKAVGLHSETFGHLIGGEEPQNGEDFVAYNLPKYIPVGLVGRCYAKIQGTIDKGDFVVISNVPGVGRRFDKDTDSPLDVIGMAVESSADEEIKLVKVKVGN